MKGMKQQNTNGDQPVGQGTFSSAMNAIKQEFNLMGERIDRLEKHMATKEDLRRHATRDDLRQFKDEIIRGFKVVAENIHQDVAGANRDEISAVQDKQREHEGRLTAVERRAGLAP